MAEEGAIFIEEPGPGEMRDPVMREEFKRASVWIGIVVALVLIWQLAQPLLLILGGIVFAAMLDGGARLLGRVLPIGRGWRLAIVGLGAIAFLAWTFVFAGMELAQQASTLRATLNEQVGKLMTLAGSIGLVRQGAAGGAELGGQLLGSIGKLTSAVGSALGAVTSLVMMAVIGAFIAIEPRLYDRGVAWMMPLKSRQGFYRTTARMAKTLRHLMAGRLIGMAVEGVFTWLLLMLGGVPMAALLGLLTGLLAFIPNIGVIVSGVLIVGAGFSVDTSTGLWALGVYAAVQIIDGYIIVPMVARRTVDLAPALVLGAQLLFGALFGILGLALADPIVGMIKAALTQVSEEEQKTVVAEPIPADESMLALAD